MIVHALSVYGLISEKIEGAALLAGMDFKRHKNHQDLASALYRDPDALGVFWSGGPKKAAAVCREWRQIAHVRNLVLALIPATSKAHSAFVPVLVGGADDVQQDTIDIRELAARFGALARRDQGKEPPVVIRGCVFLADTGAITRGDGSFVRLTKTEASILALIVARNGNVVTKEVLFNAIEANGSVADLKIIDVMICKIRKKVFAIFGEVDVIETVWGRGYRFEKEGVAPRFEDTRFVRRVG